MRFALHLIKNFLIQTMSLTLELVNNPAIKNLIQSSLESENKGLRLEWISCSNIIYIEPTQIDNVAFAIREEPFYERVRLLLLRLGNTEECTPTFVREFAKIYSLPTYKYNDYVKQPLDWTTGNKSLDSFIMESWHNIKYTYDAYLQWIEYSLLINVREMTSLRHGCKRIADWLD